MPKEHFTEIQTIITMATTENLKQSINVPPAYSVKTTHFLNNFYSIPINVGHLAAVFPFGVKNGEVRKSIAQQGLCMLFHGMYLFGSVTGIRLLYASASSHNPGWYFRFGANITTLITQICTFLIVWRKRQKFLDIWKVLETFEGDKIFSARTARNMKIFMRILCAGHIILGISIALTGVYSERNEVSSEFGNNVREVYAGYVSHGRFAFFLDRIPRPYESIEIGNLTTVEHVIASTSLISGVCRSVISIYFDLLYFDMVLILWLPVRYFANNVVANKNENTQHEVCVRRDPRTVLEGFARLRRFAALINDTFEWGMLARVLEIIMYYSVNLNVVLFPPSWVHSFGMPLLVFVAGATLILSAEICKNMDAMRTWISEPDLRRRIAETDLLLVMTGLGDNLVGISVGVCRITYTFLAGLCGTMVTYFIICVSAKP